MLHPDLRQAFAIAHIQDLQREATGQRPRIWVREPATRPVYQAR